MYKSGICDTKPAISLKRSGLESKLLQSVYRNSCTAYSMVTNLATQRKRQPILFWGAKFFHNDISHIFCRSASKFGSVGGLANRNLFPEFRELWSGVSYASVLHQYIYKVVFRQLPYVCRQFQCSFYSLRFPRIRCKLSVQVPRIPRSFPAQHGLLVLQ